MAKKAIKKAVKKVRKTADKVKKDVTDFVKFPGKVKRKLQKALSGKR